MKKLITICLVCVLTAVASQGMVVSFDENGNGTVDNGTTLKFGVDIPQIGLDQYATLYYELPGMVVTGDLWLYEQNNSSQVSDVLRFVNNYSPNSGYHGRVYVYSDTEAGEVSRELADTGIPYDTLQPAWGTLEQGTEEGWSGYMGYTPQDTSSGLQPGYMYGETVTYNFTSDIPEPATICLLSFGALSLIRRKK
jgi:hypothetical protein